MDVTSIEKDLREFNNGHSFIAKSNLKRWLGVGYEPLSKFVAGMDYRIHGKSIEYHIKDVAVRFFEAEIIRRG